MLKQPPNTDFPVVDASDITFVCDTMLQGLGKLLRKCGISTKILDNTDDHMTCLKIYQDEGRYILTRGQTFSNVCTMGECKLLSCVILMVCTIISITLVFS